ncbi:PilZ domain-containing protein [Ideonella sp. DXS29W]|uniref:PilZ domain-containing protein n=1 Tax=Ideonella lacteola TaxID=2984193 RepID=A0ABU9BZ67_9BURK
MPVDSNASPAAAPAAAERRQAPRKPLRTAATLIIGGYRLPGRTVDISQQGLCVTADRNLPSGTDCDVEFTLMENGRSHRMLLKAKVVHGVLSRQDGFKIGLMLTQVNSTAQQAIDQFMKGA